MNNRRITFGIGIAILFAVLTVSTVSAQVTLYFVPQDSSISEGEGYTTYVEIWANVTDVVVPDDDKLKMGQFAIRYDPSCINITEYPVQYSAEGWGPWIDNTMSSWNANPQCNGLGYDMVMYTFAMAVPTEPYIPSPQMIANFTVQCNSSEYCLSELNFSCGRYSCQKCPIEILPPVGPDLYPDHITLVSGTVTCGTPPPPQTFAKELAKGWNLISLPLHNGTDMAVANIIDESLSGSYDALYQYDASAPSFVSLSSTDMMENGVGYFINMTAVDTWSYSGGPCKSIEIVLSQGLNCVGWINETGSALPDALNSIDGDYNYVARWGANYPKYEVYDVNAPPGMHEFIDFETMERGNGYWIAAKEGCTLRASCP